jgi:hypothetical protein
MMYRRFGLAWLALSIAFGIHAIDEALTDFLSVYNPTVERIRERLPFLPLPTWSFELWAASLAVACALLLALTSFAFRGARWMVPLAWIFAVVMTANGVLHILGSFYLGRIMPGAYSAPLLLMAAFWLMRELVRLRPESQIREAAVGRE